MSRFSVLAAAAAAVLFAAPAYAAANLVVNGDFESVSTGDGTQISPTLGTQSVAGWSMGARVKDSTTAGLGFIFNSGQGDNTAAPVYIYGPNSGYANNGLTANSGATTTGGTNGGNYLALDADPSVNGYFSQQFGTGTGGNGNLLTVGATYALTFYWASAELKDTTQAATYESLQVSLGSQTQTTAQNNTAAGGFDPWTKVTMYFTASATNATLSFLAVGGPAGAPPAALLDAVSLVAAPEPSTWAVMLAGVGGLAGFTAMRRRSRGASIAA